MAQSKEQKAAYNKAYRATHKTEIAALNKKWNVINKEYKNKWNVNNPERVKTFNRKNHLKRKYGLTITDYDNMLAAQHNRCAICQTHMSDLSQVLEVDHSHLNGKVRGLLCHKCNSLLCEANIGRFKVTDELYSRALGYITINLN